ncbi:sodium/calcium exchanger 1 isoform X3 [Folsomia candida]|uniref:sodium/calcium exchanger 1 isoform X3 n=1 Tax=Folsomia candida TaxID=158441 RepID=UPI000B903677|nr:sodium/calcium exchanger 1 isoform X3 [Folsomia candida]
MDNETLSFSGTYNDRCYKALLLPIFPYERSWNTGVRAGLYFFGLMYCFMGVAIVADVFMSAIEKITSKTKKLYLSTGKDSEPEVFEVRIWNDTVANLTLMALGSSAPEILLSCIEVIGNKFEAGDLGPGTIVGSAAFNLLAITGVCIIGIPAGEGRSIRLIKVFLVTSAFSMFAYLWLYMVLELFTPDYIDLWEAILTFLFFPLMVVIAWWADRDWKCGKRTPVPTDQQIELGVANGSPGGESETMLEKQKKLFTAHGEVNKEALIEFYKELRKYPDISDSDAAVLAATKLIDSQPHSRMWYRIGAVRGMAGSKKIHPILSEKLREVYDAVNQSPDVPDLGQVPAIVTDHHHNEKSIVEFHSASFAVPENIGKFNITVVRHGRMDNTVRVRIESFDGSAKAGSDYVQVNEQLVFGPYAKEREVSISIIDDNQWEPDEEFFLRLSVIDDGFEKRDAVLGRLPIMEIVILNDDNPGVISFKKRGILVKESCNIANLEVERTNGADGEISVDWKTIDGSAKSPSDFQGGEGTLTFKHGELVRTIEIPIVDDLDPEKDECFEVEISNPQGGCTLGRIRKLAVTISNDDDFNSVMQRMMVMTSSNLKSMEVHKETWGEQLQVALTVNGGDVENATGMDYVMHFLTFGWKVIFALIPPPGIMGGWLCFFSSLVAIGFLTAIVGDLATIFGCLIGLTDTVTAITFVALGTSLPDLFASKAAATGEKYADNAIGNVTGSNAVNVFLGLGLPWVLASIYHVAIVGDRFYYPAGSLAFSVFVYAIVATLALILILVRRYASVFGKSELGGPTVPKYFSGIFLFTLWFLYILLSSLQAYGYIHFLAPNPEQHGGKV